MPLLIIGGGKDQKKGDLISNYRLETLHNVELKILAKVPAKRLVCIIKKLVGKVQMCTIPYELIQENLHLICYTLKRIGRLSSILIFYQHHIF